MRVLNSRTLRQQRRNEGRRPRDTPSVAPTYSSTAARSGIAVAPAQHTQKTSAQHAFILTSRPPPRPPFPCPSALTHDSIHPSG